MQEETALLTPKKRSNSTGTIYVDNTICTQDVSVTIKVVCTVIHHHIYDSYMNRSVSRVGSYDETTEQDNYPTTTPDSSRVYFNNKGNSSLTLYNYKFLWIR